MTWMAPVMIVLSVTLLGRAHYVLYVKKQGNLTTKVVTWLATIAVTSVWIWKLIEMVRNSNV